VALLAPDQQILVLTSLGPSPPVIGGGPLIPGAARVTTRLSNKFGEREPVVQCRPVLENERGGVLVDKMSALSSNPRR